MTVPIEKTGSSTEGYQIHRRLGEAPGPHKRDHQSTLGRFQTILALFHGVRFSCNRWIDGHTHEYRLSRYDRFLGGALGTGDGDTEGIILAIEWSSSQEPPLISEQRPDWSHGYMRSPETCESLSSFDMGEAEMQEYAATLGAFKPRFIRGYASSVYYFARWLKENDASLPSIAAVFTTAEKLMPHMRKVIEETFCCEAYDNYGLMDGGVSAYECPEHSGMHIDTERSIMEVVDPSGCQVVNGGGQIRARACTISRCRLSVTPPGISAALGTRNAPVGVITSFSTTSLQGRRRTRSRRSDGWCTARHSSG